MALSLRLWSRLRVVIQGHTPIFLSCWWGYSFLICRCFLMSHWGIPPFFRHDWRVWLFAYLSHLLTFFGCHTGAYPPLSWCHYFWFSFIRRVSSIMPRSPSHFSGSPASCPNPLFLALCPIFFYLSRHHALCRPSILSSSHMSFIAIPWWPINTHVSLSFLSHLGDYGWGIYRTLLQLLVAHLDLDTLKHHPRPT